MTVRRLCGRHKEHRLLLLVRMLLVLLLRVPIVAIVVVISGQQRRRRRHDVRVLRTEAMLRQRVIGGKRRSTGVRFALRRLHMDVLIRSGRGGKDDPRRLLLQMRPGVVRADLDVAHELRLLVWLLLSDVGGRWRRRGGQ